MNGLRFDNLTRATLPGDPNPSPRPRQVRGAFWSDVAPRAVPDPRLVAHSPEVAAMLGLSPEETAGEPFVQLFSGNRLLPGMQPFATCYGGHQFGQWAGQLGDGRAILLGETITPTGERLELQLKGAGSTPYSRTADGLAVLRSSIREFLCSEAMHHLGIPTTRALSVITTGERVIRDMFYDGHPRPEPGAVVCRVAPSFIRFGHFELFTRRGEIDLTRQLLDFTLKRDFPELAAVADPVERRARLFSLVCERTARLMVAWMRVGFVHGVMNTDNMSITGLTIDYGPYGWLEEFDPLWTPNTTDASGRRYACGRQPEIARWNLERLAEALSPLLEHGDLTRGVNRFDDIFATEFSAMLAGKLGWEALRETDGPLITSLFALLQSAEVDMTDFFRRLAEMPLTHPDPESLRPAFYRASLFAAHRERFSAWLADYARRPPSGTGWDDPARRRERMNAVNPRFILRNHLAQQAIDRAEQGDHTLVRTLLEVSRHPFEARPEEAQWLGIRPEWARDRPGCSMLSCSS